MHVRTHTYTHTHIHTQTQIHTHKHKHTHTHTHTQTHTNKQPHTHTHTHNLSNTQTHLTHFLFGCFVFAHRIHNRTDTSNEICGSSPNSQDYASIDYPPTSGRRSCRPRKAEAEVLKPRSFRTDRLRHGGAPSPQGRLPPRRIPSDGCRVWTHGPAPREQWLWPGGTPPLPVPILRGAP